MRALCNSAVLFLWVFTSADALLLPRRGHDGSGPRRIVAVPFLLSSEGDHEKDASSGYRKESKSEKVRPDISSKEAKKTKQNQRATVAKEKPKKKGIEE